jgi:DNA topoisomerase-1
MDQTDVEGTPQEKRLYDLIWKRTAASQMADAEIEKTTVNITISGSNEIFIAQGEVVKFDGFIKVYRESVDDEEMQDEFSHILPPLNEGQELTRREILATERFTQGPQRYTEASLVHKLEELGIGRPSTYAPTISTIQQREYVQKGDKKGEERQYTVDILKGKQITEKTRKELYEIISAHSGQPYDKVFADADRDYWMSAEEAKAYGMVDEILTRKK